MRAQLAVTLALTTFVTEMHAEDINALAQPYVLQAADVARQVLVAEFSKHPERVHHISITFSFQVDARGEPHNMKIVSKTRNAWAANTARRALSAAKFPPIPKKIVQTGADLVNIQGDFDADAANATAPGSATLAYQDRLNDIVIHLLAPRLATQFDLLRDAGTLKLIYRVRANGDVDSVKIISRANQFVTDTCVQSIKSAKLPPIPKSVIKEQGHEWVDVHTDISLDR
jgi:hypothetical protein